MSDSNSQAALMWLERGRADKAEGELRRALTQDPDDGELHWLLALCLLDLDRDAEAVEAARATVSRMPEFALAHVALSRALVATDAYDDGLRSAERAIELDPDEPRCFATLASAHLATRRWKRAALAAEEGLALDPSHEECLNARAFANTQLGRGAAASEDLAAALHHDPDNPTTHFNLGWNALQGGRSRQAREHFREALRLQPGWEPARKGLVEAIKSSNPLLRPIFWVLLQFTKLPPKAVIAVLIASVVLRKVLAGLTESYPDYAAPLWILYWAIVGLVLFSLVVDPILDVLLLLHPDGRYALSAREKLRGGVVLGLLVGGGVSLAFSGDSLVLLALALCLLVSILGWSVALGTNKRSLRTKLVGAMGVLMLVAVWAVWDTHVRVASDADTLISPWCGLVSIGSLVINWSGVADR